MEVCFRERPLWQNVQEMSRLLEGRLLPQLHAEIQHFHDAVSPTQQDVDLRDFAVDRFRHIVKLLWPSCKVKIYGSFATHLFLPSSDVDLLILTAGCYNSPDNLQILADHLKMYNFATSLEVISMARVPIVRFKERESGISFDVKLECRLPIPAFPMELRVVAAINHSCSAFYPAIEPLYKVLKTLLLQENLNAVFQYGGIPSYMLFVMLKAFLQKAVPGFQRFNQEHAAKHGFLKYAGKDIFGAEGDRAFSESIRESPLYLALLLLGFLHFYGICFKSQIFGISVRDGGSYFKKKKTGFYIPSKPYLLAVEDPLNPANDIGKNSFNYEGAQAAFLKAYEGLTSEHSTHNLLYGVIPLAKSWEALKSRQRGNASLVAFMIDQVWNHFESSLHGRSEKSSDLLKFLRDLNNPQDSQKYGDLLSLISSKMKTAVKPLLTQNSVLLRDFKKYLDNLPEKSHHNIQLLERNAELKALVSTNISIPATILHQARSVIEQA